MELCIYIEKHCLRAKVLFFHKTIVSPEKHCVRSQKHFLPTWYYFHHESSDREKVSFQYTFASKCTENTSFFSFLKIYPIYSAISQMT